MTHSQLVFIWVGCSWLVALTQTTYEQADADQLFILIADIVGDLADTL